MLFKSYLVALFIITALNNNLKSYIFIISTICIGTFISFLILNMVKKIIPTDFIRTNTIIETLKDKSINKDVVFFGSSVCMSAIDGKKLTTSSKSIYNLGSFEQNIIESTCYYQYISEETKSIYQCISIEDLSIFESKIHERIQKRLLFYDYKIENKTTILLNPIESSSMNLDLVNQLLLFRTIPFQSIRNIISYFFKNNYKKMLSTITNEIYSPYHYSKKVSKEKLDWLIKAYTPEIELNHYDVANVKVNLIKRNAAFWKAKNIDYTVIINPINPEIKNYTTEFKTDLKQKLNTIGGVKIIDLSTFLNAEDFIDHVHINKKGRDKITKFLKNKI